MYLWKVIIFYCNLQVITSEYLPMIVREANTNDNQGLLDLNRKAPMKGYLQVRIDRDLDFFEVTRRRGKEYYTFVVEDKNRIIACWSIVKHVKGLLRIKIGVLGFATSLQGNSNLIEILKEGILFEDHPLS